LYFSISINTKRIYPQDAAHKIVQKFPGIMSDAPIRLREPTYNYL